MVDFAIWSHFKKCSPNIPRPRHLLCHGLRRTGANGSGQGEKEKLNIPGIVRQHPNENVDRLKSAAWTHILALLGADGEAIMSSLLLDCGVFIRLPSGNGNYFQISGVPITELSSTTTLHDRPLPGAAQNQQAVRKPSDIRFARNRMLYAKASLNGKGKVRFGLKHVHVLERYSDSTRPEQSAHILKYMFPRQFGLHNVFTSVNDLTGSARQFKDYTFREQEINCQHKHSPAWIPRRLRGQLVHLVSRVHKNHQHCSYTQLLRYYCPVNPASGVVRQSAWHHGIPLPTGSEQADTQLNSSTFHDLTNDETADAGDGHGSYMRHGTPVSKVSAFCQAVVRHLFPKAMFGHGIDGEHNLMVMLSNIDLFIQLRRFETMSLQQVVQRLRIKSIVWLRPATTPVEHHLSASDVRKRVEILNEFVYYIFDSVVIPLVQSHFYVTESAVYRNRLFFFRHDVWRRLSEPALTSLTLSMYAPLRPKRVRQVLENRSLGYSQVRLLPKDHGVRPIMNLRRRMTKSVSGRQFVGSSINAQLAPVFNVLNSERVRDPSLLGSALLSVGDLHEKLLNFKRRIPAGTRLYFVKVDIRSCFDTIPQGRLMDTVRRLIINETGYRTSRHGELKFVHEARMNPKGQIRRRFVGAARPTDDMAVISGQSVARQAEKKRNVVFVDTGNQRVWSSGQLLKLLQEHVQENIVKIGKRHLKQIRGIPQGSVLSSLLCSLFYTAFERERLAFLDPASCLLLRLIDDFLLVTTKESQARTFLQVMTAGDPSFGISVNPDKTLASFDASVEGHKVSRLHDSSYFPYCGLAIDTRTLELRKDRDKKDAFVCNALTIDWSVRPGWTLRRKIQSSFKLQMHAMLLDLSLNSSRQVILTLIGNFTETAMKLHRYLIGLALRKRPSEDFVIRTIEDLVSLAIRFCHNRNVETTQTESGMIRGAQICWAAAAAFEQVLSRKQALYRRTLAWLRQLRQKNESHMNMRRPILDQLVRDNRRMFHEYVY